MGDAVDHDPEEHDREPRSRTLAPLLAAREAEHGVVAQGSRSDQAADHHHRQDVEQALVGREHQRALGHRQLHLGDLLPGRGAGGARGLDRGLRHGLHAVGHQLDGGRGGVDDTGDDGGEPGRTEQGQHRDQVDERGDRLPGVEQRTQHQVGPRPSGHPDPEHDGQHHHQEGRHQGHVQGDHRVVPQPEDADPGQAEDRRDQGPHPAEGQGDQRDGDGRDVPRGVGQQGLQRVEQHGGDEVLEGARGTVEQVDHPGHEAVQRLGDVLAQAATWGRWRRRGTGARPRPGPGRSRLSPRAPPAVAVRPGRVRGRPARPARWQPWWPGPA